MLSASYKYQVALSFAGEQRKYVDAVAEILKANGILVFYDKYEEAELWGQPLVERLQKIYRDEAKYVVIFSSKEYAAKVWTTHERRSAQERAIRENMPYILPARFDDSEIPGISSAIAYVDLKVKSPLDVCKLIAAKLDMDIKGPSETLFASEAAGTSIGYYVNFVSRVLDVDFVNKNSIRGFLSVRPSSLRSYYSKDMLMVKNSLKKFGYELTTKKIDSGHHNTGAVWFDCVGDIIVDISRVLYPLIRAPRILSFYSGGVEHYDERAVSDVEEQLFNSYEAGIRYQLNFDGPRMRGDLLNFVRLNDAGEHLAKLLDG